MSEAAKAWASWVKNQPIDEAAIGRLCDRMQGVMFKKSTSKGMAGLLAEANATIQRQHAEIKALRGRLEEAGE